MTSPELAPAPAAGNWRCGSEVVARDEHRPADLAHIDYRAQRDHLSVVVAKAEQVQALGPGADGAFGLDDHLPVPPELVEIVDVQRAEEDLERPKGLVKRDS